MKGVPVSVISKSAEDLVKGESELWSVDTEPSTPRMLADTLVRNPGALFGMTTVAVLVICAVLAGVISPQDPFRQDLAVRLQPPMSTFHGHLHVLGTDLLGRDMLSRVIYGSRASLTVGVSSVLVGASIGLFLGVVAGYYGGWVDLGVMRWIDLQLSIPFLVLAIAVMAVLGPSLRNIVIVLALTGYVTYARVVRSETLSIKGREYVVAARALGAGDGRLLIRHVIPNILPSLIVIGTTEVARMITAEAALSYLGLGVQPPTPAWGTMVFDGQTLLPLAPWVSIAPGIAIVVTVLAINLLGDWLREVIDPRLRVAT